MVENKYNILILKKSFELSEYLESVSWPVGAYEVKTVFPVIVGELREIGRTAGKLVTMDA